MKYTPFIIMLFVFTALIAYAVTRGCQALRLYPVVRNIYLVTTIVMYVALVVGGILGIFVKLPFAKVLAFIGHTSLIVFIYLIISFLLVDIVRIFNYFFHFAPQGMILFRQWALVASVAIIAVVMIVGNYRFNHPKIIHKEVTLQGKPLQGKSMKIVAASDIHLGTSIDKKRLNRYVELINAQHPDLVLLAGDICDNALAPIVSQHMHEDLKKIQAPLGVYAITGNHEYIGRDVDGAVAYLESGNIRMLRDSAVLVDSLFYLIGRDDRTNHNRKPLKDLMVGLDPAKPVILLDHQPYHLEEAEQSNVDLQISGHTHDGQFFPVNLIVRSMYENPHGYSTRGNTHYIVSSGLGIWGPQYRIGTQSELIVIDFKY